MIKVILIKQIFMPKPKQYPLKDLIKAAQILAAQKGFDRVEYESKKGSAVRFEVFLKGESDPTDMWVVHTSHDKKRLIWSKDDYKKTATSLKSELEELIALLERL